MTAPDPMNPFPLAEGERRCMFVRPLLTSDRTEVGEYTYYDASEDSAGFEESRVLYAFGPERLVIGRFCSIAVGVRFVMPGANHVSSGPSAYPFTIFPGAWQEGTLEAFQAGRPGKRDTVVGNDVWFGRDVTVMPGVQIGDGAIIATGSMVTRDVEPYTIVGGNPAAVVRRRFSDADVRRLLAAAWWDWPVDVITRHAATLMAGDVAEIERIAAEEVRVGADR
ncbi:CatB-related O-acetyltransferase [Marinitenerispora sediminis]|uniref:CatB-related O-acetyltransferase n=1 Tax=Marinitenerispora sediminis TaxID=1931232 RepID=UPI0018F19459|nr:CatB-related O-acetyltransferase [Marinitenerispora sediminis]